uniref:Uncharacterized protein n=1 Tax=Arundo donax TaxID=35708 RepID=A0A0A8XWC4_ARUDO
MDIQLHPSIPIFLMLAAENTLGTFCMLATEQDLRLQQQFDLNYVIYES